MLSGTLRRLASECARGRRVCGEAAGEVGVGAGKERRAPKNWAPVFEAGSAEDSADESEGGCDDRRGVVLAEANSVLHETGEEAARVFDEFEPVGPDLRVVKAETGELSTCSGEDRGIWGKNNPGESAFRVIPERSWSTFDVFTHEPSIGQS